VHAFEPNVRLRDKLQDNVVRNGFANVNVHSEALARESGSVRFFTSTLESNQGISSILPGAGRESVGEVPATSLDDFAARLGTEAIDVIKMDIEGAELQVIAGGSRTLAGEGAPLLIFEAAELEPIADALGRFGYTIRAPHYSLSRGLELRQVGAQGDNLFAAYEAPNYFAAKSSATFDEVVARANGERSSLLQLLGRL
jgi:FkbM family methyltransferase